MPVSGLPQEVILGHRRVDCQKLADTSLTNTHFLLLIIPVKAFTTGFSSFVLRLLAAALLEVYSLSRVDRCQKPDDLSFGLSSSMSACTFSMSLSSQCGGGVQIASVIHARDL